MAFIDFLNILIKNVFFLKPDFRGTHFLTKKLNLSFVYLASIVGLSNQLRQDIPYNTANLHALLHELYFSIHRFLDVCP